MIKIIHFYLKTNYFAQRYMGWSDAKAGLIYAILTHLLFISSGFVLFLSSYFKVYSFYISMTYIVFYMLFIYKKFEKTLLKKINFDLLNAEYKQINLFRKIYSVILSILMLFISIILMIYIIKTLSFLF